MENLTLENIEYQLLMAIHNSKESGIVIHLSVFRFEDGIKSCSILFDEKDKVNVLSFYEFEDDKTNNKKLNTAIEAINGDRAAFMKMADIRHDK